MTRKIVITGVAGGVAMFVWLFVVNGIFGFGSRINMKTVQDERSVYDILESNVVAPGRYVVNPEVDPAVGFPYGEPVFAVTYAGVGHEAAGQPTDEAGRAKPAAKAAGSVLPRSVHGPLISMRCADSAGASKCSE